MPGTKGTVAHDDADSGNPVKVGGYGSASIPTAVAAGDRVNLWLSLNGAIVPSGPETVLADGSSAVGSVDLNSAARWPGALSLKWNGTGYNRDAGDLNGTVVQPALSATFWQYAAAAGGIVSSTADVALKAAGAAGVRNFLSSITINHDTLSAVSECVIKDGATVIWRGKLQTAATDVANGAGTIRFNPPLRGTAATAMNFALLTSVTGGVFVNAQGYTGS